MPADYRNTGITKAQSAANYIFGLRSTVPPENQDDYPPRSDKEPKAAVSMISQDLEFSYPQRPKVKVLKGVNANVSTLSPRIVSWYMVR